MKVRPDLVPETERNNLEVIQLTDESIPSSHVYMEAQIFTPDSQRLILHRSAHPHGSDPQDPEHQFLVCNLEDNCSLTPITTELERRGRLSHRMATTCSTSSMKQSQEQTDD